VSSLLLDFQVRVAPKATIGPATVERLAWAGEKIETLLALRSLRLNAVTAAYGPLWEASYDHMFLDDSWTKGPRRDASEFGSVGRQWTTSIPLRVAIDRRQASVELDALAAIALGVNIDELCVIYRTQFPVLYGYDRNSYLYDAHGRLVPNSVLTVWRKKGDRITEEERTATNQAGNTYTYDLPFVTLDREADMRQAYAEFERRLAERA